MADGSRTSFLDPAVLARIDNLELLARTVVDGFLQGIHRSPYLGASMDFAEHRPYMPGDDIRRIDWRLYARTDRFHIKQYEAETNADVAFLLDVSASMDYRSGPSNHGAAPSGPSRRTAGRSGPSGHGAARDGPTSGPAPVGKLDYARYLTASLAWFSAGQKDRVGLYAFDDDVVEHVRPSAAHLDKVLQAVARVVAGGEGSWDRPLARVANTFRRRGILVVASDFYDEPESVATALGLFRAQGHDVAAFHVLDPAEIDFPFSEVANFRDMETQTVLPVAPDQLAADYRERVGRHIAAMGEQLGRHGVDYVLLNTAEPLDRALHAYLAFRQKTIRVR